MKSDCDHHKELEEKIKQTKDELTAESEKTTTRLEAQLSENENNINWLSQNVS